MKLKDWFQRVFFPKCRFSESCPSYNRHAVMCNGAGSFRPEDFCLKFKEYSKDVDCGNKD